ncbi:MAG: MFS transporter [Candidatus Bipolaricaulia bacterium]
MVEASPADQQTQRRLLILLFVGVLMGALDIAIIGPVLPTLQATFGVGERGLAWIFTIYVLFNLVGTPLMAKLADRFGRRSIYILDVTLFAVGSLLVATAPSFATLLLGRAVQGLGSGGIFPVASAVIGDTFPPERRGRALGLLGAVFGIAFLIGPILSGALLMLGWRWLFLINLPIAAGLIGAGWRLLPTRHEATPSPFDWLGMLTLGAALAGLTYALDQLDTQNLIDSVTSAEIGPFLLVGAVLVPVFVALERRMADPVLAPRLFRTRQSQLAGLLAIGAGFFEGALVFVPGLLVTVYGVTSSTAAFMLAPVVVALAIGAPLLGRALDAVGSRWVILVGTALLSLGLGGVAAVGDRLAGFYISMIVVGLGLSSLVGAPLRYIMLGEASADDRASAQGAISMLTRIGMLASGAVIGAVIDSHGGGLGGYQLAYGVTALVALLLALLALGLKRRPHEQATLSVDA